MDSAAASEARQEWTGRAHLKWERTSKEGREREVAAGGRRGVRSLSSSV